MRFLLMLLVSALCLSANEPEVVWGYQSTCPIPGMPGTICSGPEFKTGINVAIKNSDAVAYSVVVVWTDEDGEHAAHFDLVATGSDYTFHIEYLSDKRISVAGVYVEAIY
jgi:hypothetical protein